MEKTFFISTAIDYPSYNPHIGHALEKLQADAVARYKRLQGYEVHFSIGTDEHGLKMERSAEKAGKATREFVDGMSEKFKKVYKILNISNDDFIRTTEKRHAKVVSDLFDLIYKKGDIYKGKYEGIYCVDCESYYLEKDLKDGKCPVHNKKMEKIEEETYFFKMGEYQEQLVAHIKKNKDYIIPTSRRNEILQRLKDPIHDLSISRKKVKWGINLPIDNDFTLFVWVDALINYLTTIDYPNAKFKKFWPANIHVIGKDIIWHHVVIWGTLLMSAGLPLSKKIFSHGFITSGGKKMSKSLKNIIDPFELVKKYGADPVRYFLFREFSSTDDGDFSTKRLEERYNADLANGLGNLVSRVLTLSAKAKAKKVSQAKSVFNKQIKQTKKKYDSAMEDLKFNEALEAVWQLISFCDNQIEQNKPWELIKKDIKKAKGLLGELLYVIDQISIFLVPFMPLTAEKISQQLKQNKKAEPLFPRL